jgi:rhodanese-related sulfurtransferase
MMPLTEVGGLGATGSLIAALAIGFAFGWCLERGGLGSAPKLAGQFYLADLTVFKVMFSALVTAMLGAFWLDAFGLLDLSLVYLPETFVTSQALGGALFGAGFLFAGLCPGTSCVAAAAGRIDGFAVIAGMLGGVLTFNVGYPHLEGVYTATSLGAVTIGDLAGVRRGVMVAIVTAVALGAFVLAGRPFMMRRQRAAESQPHIGARHRALAGIAAALALGAAAVDLRTIDAGSLAAEIEHERDHISAPDLAQLIMDGDRAVRIFDLRSPAEFDRMHIAGATHATIEKLGEKVDETLAREQLPRDATIVLYSEGGAHAAQAWVLLRLRGYRRVFFLREGMFEWLSRVVEPRLATDATPSERAEFDRATGLSRFFGGTARENVSRSEVPIGYWNNPAEADASSSHHDAAAASATGQMIARIRRRGC